MTAQAINQLKEVGLWIWQGLNIGAFGLTVSPVLENTEAMVRILSGCGVFASAMVALYFTVKKNKKK